MPLVSKKMCPKTAVSHGSQKNPWIWGFGVPKWRASERNQPKAYNTPVFKKTKREELAEKWDNLGFSIRPMNGHVRPEFCDFPWQKWLDMLATSSQFWASKLGMEYM